MGKLLFVVLIVSFIRLADFNCISTDMFQIPIFLKDYPTINRYYTRTCCDQLTCDGSCYYSDFLCLQNFTLSRITDGQFRHFGEYRLNGIFLQNLNIETIVPGAFNYQSNMELIYIDKNAISVVTDGIFNSLTNLLILDLSSNRIESISDHAFVGTKLAYLNLNNNRLKRFLNDYILRSIDKLVYLHLGCNNISSLDSDMSNSSVTNLTLCNNNIDFINVTLLPRNLTKVDFSFNKIFKVENMRNLKSYEILLNGNALHNFKVNDVTEILDISENCIQQLDNDSLGKSLTVLKLNSNNISEIPSTLKTSNVKVLDLSENHIQYLNNDMFGAKLEILKLASNNISQIQNSCFHNLTNLVELDLSHNNLSRISLGTFDSLYNLNILNVSYNRLTEMPVHQLHSLQNLRLLYVQNNQISNVNVEDSLTYLPRFLRQVNLKNNNWSCKNLLNFIQVLKRTVQFSDDEKVDSMDGSVHGIICKQNESSDGLEIYKSQLEQNNLFKYFETLNANNRATNKELQNLNNINSGIKQNQEILIGDLKQGQESVNQLLEKLINMNSGIKQEQVNLLKTQDKSNHLLEVFFMKLYQNVTPSNQSWNVSKPSSDKLVAAEIQKNSQSNGVFNSFCIIMLMTIVAILGIICYLIKIRIPKPQVRSELNLMQHFEGNE